MLGGKWGKTRCPIGVDVGQSAVRLLQLERRSGGWSALAAAERPLPRELPTSGEAHQEAVRLAISDMLDSGSFVGNRCVSALPASIMTYKNLRLPKMPADELRSAVEWEANDRVHLGTESPAIQFIEAGEVRQGDELRHEVILMAAPNEFIEAHVGMLTTCGLAPAAVEVGPTALCRCMSSGPSADLEAPASVIVDIGRGTTKVLICRNERVLFYKQIDLAGKHLDETVARNLEVPIEDAVDLRRRVASGEDDQAAESGSQAQQHVERAVFEALRPVVADLGREVGLCLRYYSVTFRGKRPVAATLLGGEAHHPWLARMLGESAGIEFEVTDALAEIDCSAVSRAIPTGTPATTWATAAGLSMRHESMLSMRGLALGGAA